MNTPDTPGPFRSIERNDWQLPALLISIATAMGVLYWSERTTVAPLNMFLVVSILPIVIAAYGRHGTARMILVLMFIASAMLPAVLASSETDTVAITLVTATTYILLLGVFGYFTASLASYIHARRQLTGTVQEHEGLLSRANNLSEVQAFVLQQASILVNASDAALIMRSPLDGQWEVRNGTTTSPLNDCHIHSLARWLLEQFKPLVVNDIEQDPRFTPVKSLEGIEPVSLLTFPLTGSDGTLGVLALFSRPGSSFGADDLEALQPLVTASQQALAQATRCAQTDQVLDRRLRQLNALQRAAGQLNATTDLREIVRRTLTNAVEMTGAEAGLVSVQVVGLAPAYSSWKVAVSADALERFMTVAPGLPPLYVTEGAGQDAPVLLTTCRSRLLAPIRRERQTLGVVVLESRDPNLFGPESQRSLAGLTDHAAIALENARLFNQILCEKQKLDQIMETVAEPLLTTDADGCVITMNHGAEILTGWRAEEAIGHRLCRVIACHLADSGMCEVRCPVIRTKLERRPARAEAWPVVTRQGEKRFADVSAAAMPTSAGQFSGAVILMRDITSRVEIEEFQRTLITAFSHELRTPLTIMNTALEMLLDCDQVQPRLDADATTLLRALQRQTHRLTEFADEIMSLARIDSQTLSLELMPLPAQFVLHEIVGVWRSVLADHPFTITAPPQPVWVRADEQALRSVLDALIDNAAKYSPAGSPIDVSIALAPEGIAKISVLDHGPGIAADSLDRIFERFYRGDRSDSQQVFGHGLGLYISRYLVEAMGGTICVHSQSGEGCCFIVTLPLWSSRENSLTGCQDY